MILTHKINAKKPFFFFIDAWEEKARAFVINAEKCFITLTLKINEIKTFFFLYYLSVKKRQVL